jgi:pilus assembly protein Flp/PilA
VKLFVACERGATAVEYGLIVACVFLAIIGGVNFFASSANSMFTNIGSSVGAATH